MAESVEAQAFREPSLLHVYAELVQQPLRVARVGLPGGPVNAGREVGEQSRVLGRLEVFEIVQETCVQDGLMDRDAADGGFALDRLPGPDAFVTRQIFVHGGLDRDAPDTTFLNNVAALELGEFIDPSAAVEPEDRPPPPVGPFARPRGEVLGIKNTLQVFRVEEPLGFLDLRING